MCAKLFVCIVGVLAVGTVFAEDKKGRAADSARVDGTFAIAAEDEGIDGVTLKIILYEFDPRLADAPADKLDEVSIERVTHQKGKATVVAFTVGKDKKIRADRQYYVSCRGYRGEEYVYYGTPSHGDIGKVLTEGNPVKVVFAGKRLKP